MMERCEKELLLMLAGEALNRANCKLWAFREGHIYTEEGNPIPALEAEIAKLSALIEKVRDE